MLTEALTIVRKHRLELPSHLVLLIKLNPDSLTPLINDVKQIVYRIVLGIITAAFIIGLATILPAYRQVIGILGIGVFFVIGLILVFVLGASLATAMLRSRKK